MSNETSTHERVRIYITGDCEGLVKAAYDAGSSDNITAVLLTVAA